MDRDGITLCSAMIVELWMRKREMGNEDENNVIIRGYDKTAVRLA
jgi:hypothetical protein